MAAFGRAYGIPPNRIGGVISKYRNALYRNRYRIKANLEGNKPSDWAWRYDIAGKNYLTGEVYLCSSAREMEAVCGVHRGTISYQLQREQLLTNGWSFQRVDRPVPWLTPDITAVQESIHRYTAKKLPREKKYGVSAMDYRAGIVTSYRTFKDASLKLGVDAGTIRYLLGCEGLRLFRGLVFQYTDECVDWPIYSAEHIDVSLRVKKPEYPLARVTDLHLGTTKLYASTAEFARENGYNPAVVANWIRLNPDKPFTKRYRIEKESLERIG
jgi:hypothetical protein